MPYFPLHGPNHLQLKFYPIMQDFKRVLDFKIKIAFKPISGRVDRASATEAVDSGSISGRVKPNTIKINIHSFPA